ncbi:hypothetical protein [uncultured Algibacter sp.]|uniref:hypothetical protein n=1 Tax=uncultured Algibacter sp. TaxID=298659 RepID=UPI0026362069|nr:hypothetical protein [uncultured Algibacter sp.]
MKKLIYIFFVLIVISCNSRDEKIMNLETIEVNANYETEDIENNKIKPNTFIYEDLSTQKLQEMYDLISLKEKHPEFAKTITSQLKAYTDDNISLSNSTDISIKNIKLKEEIIQVSDSVQKMKLSYDILSNNSMQKDSICAIITSNEISFEGKKIKSKKIKFKAL